MDIRWTCKAFQQLSVQELYSILALRNEVFVVEQNCPYQDCDGKDSGAHHLMGWARDNLVAYTRLLPPGLAYEEMSIGRVVTSPGLRRTGAGRLLMKNSIEKIRELYGPEPIRIGAQLYLKNFYQSFGFEVCSDIYLEDGIEHIKMLLK